MKSLYGIRLQLVAFLLAIVLHEASAKPNNYQKRVFRARQSEARRNHVKYNPEANGVDIYTGFLLKKDCIEFVLPTLSKDDKLEQTFTPDDGRVFLLACRRKQEFDFATQQGGALRLLKQGKLHLYKVGEITPPSFTFFITPLTKAEQKTILSKHKRRLTCDEPPIPGLKQIAEQRLKNRVLGVKTMKYTYGEDKQTCDYFELGIETLETGEYVNQKLEMLTYWTPLFNVCHDVKNSVTVFTKHTIKSDHLIHRKLNHNIKINPENEKVFVDQQYDQYYDLENQKKSFKARECQREEEEFDTGSNYLVRAHLIPDHDTLYESFQYTTNNYLNYAPQWRSVNMGQWLNVEQDIRFMAMGLRKDVTTYTGVHYRKNACTLNIPVQEEGGQNASSSSKAKLKLNPIRIPSIFYKYVHTNNAGIVIITANGVSGSLDEIKCTDVCAQYSWLYGNSDYQHRKIVSSGQTKCCIPDDFFNQKEIKNSLPSLPKGELKRTKILNFHGFEEEMTHANSPVQEIKNSLPSFSKEELERTKIFNFHDLKEEMTHANSSLQEAAEPFTRGGGIFYWGTRWRVI